ncbi:hypothetical protein HGRIS_012338 [Hohenbuehelia grisea]|uniref:Uncharacterized protein n=1 Tax=Hohenbuehelia grisea TaxID=104357 RepID=A0ABR3IS07_9AGAR
MDLNDDDDLIEEMDVDDEFDVATALLGDYADEGNGADVDAEREGGGNADIRSRSKEGHDDLGTFGGVHLDGGDTVVIKSKVVSLSKPHPDIDPRDELFFIADCGIAWQMEELSIISFNSQRFHAVAYSPESMMNAQGSLAFCAIQGGPPGDSILRVTKEMRDPRKRKLSERATVEHATFLADGLAIMEPKSFLDNTARTFLQQVDSMVQQIPAYSLFRYDRDKFLSSFSMVIDGVRTAAGPWENGIEWSGDDTRVGKKYEVDPHTLPQ